eukprot:CAMPEP_0180328854 /NCGR_PEP_ID=MMETSP0988-20121125/40443_1 /TAXON_ID=697907 /ORGANISM="non described non described, Strain CCMP2293" /LENGTH=106 /DNA_ID=CAMNT_0022315905 /DNA_START=56 /DNA_END=376 /DNA_ORIENTATION=+
MKACPAGVSRGKCASRDMMEHVVDRRIMATETFSNIGDVTMRRVACLIFCHADVLSSSLWIILASSTTARTPSIHPCMSSPESARNWYFRPRLYPSGVVEITNSPS